MQEQVADTSLARSSKALSQDDPERLSIERMRRGEIQGLAYLVKEHQLKAVRIAAIITRDVALAEEVVQETFLRCYKRIHQFKTDRPFEPWFLRSVSNAALRAVQKRDRTRPLDSIRDENRLAELADTSLSPEEQVEQAETHEEVWAALGSMPAEQRYVLVFRYFFDMTEKEISKSMSSPLGTIKWRISAGKKLLRRLLTLQGHLDTEERI